jgi:hypothetical protein
MTLKSGAFMDPISISKTISASPITAPSLQDDKHLGSGDSVWILTDVEAYESSFYGWSEPQLLFKVGVYDLATQKLGFATFGRDIAYSLLKAGLAPPPWTTPQAFGITLHRHSHDGEERGRYLTTVSLLPIEPALLAIVVPAGARFVRMKHWPNAYQGIWREQEERATQDNAIESACLGMSGSFRAGDVKKACGVPDANVTPILKRLVIEGKLLPPTGKKRGTRYQVAPPP